MAAILMTPLLRPDAELRWANWLELLQIPQSLILYRSPKIVTKFTRDHFFGPFDIDYSERNFWKYFLERAYQELLSVLSMRLNYTEREKFSNYLLWGFP